MSRIALETWLNHVLGMYERVQVHVNDEDTRDDILQATAVHDKRSAKEIFHTKIPRLENEKSQGYPRYLQSK